MTPLIYSEIQFAHHSSHKLPITEHIANCMISVVPRYVNIWYVCCSCVLFVQGHYAYIYREVP